MDEPMKYSVLILIVITLLAVTSCSGGSQREILPAAQLLPASISSLDLSRNGDVITFHGDSLSQYVGSFSDWIRRFSFVELASAEYARDSIVVVVDIMQFETPLDAYGLYLFIRYGETDIVPLGVEGFKQVNEYSFVKGPYFVHTIGYDDREEPARVLDDFTTYFANELPGKTDPPDVFSVFPTQNLIARTDLYYPAPFMGYDFMGPVLGRGYAHGSDTVTMYLATDSAGPRVLAWSKVAEQDSALSPCPESISFDDGKGFVHHHPRYGDILVGMKKDKMVIMMGYADSLAVFVDEWLREL
jgi:hypothetical protein